MRWKYDLHGSKNLMDRTLKIIIPKWDKLIDYQQDIYSFVAGNLLAIRAGGGGQDHLDHEAVHASHLPALLSHLQDTRQGNLTIENDRKHELKLQYRRTALILMSLAPTREYWMVFRGPGFFAVVRFGSSLNPPSLQARPTTHRDTEKERQETEGWERSQII